MSDYHKLSWWEFPSFRAHLLSKAVLARRERPSVSVCSRSLYQRDCSLTRGFWQATNLAKINRPNSIISDEPRSSVLVFECLILRILSRKARRLSAGPACAPRLEERRPKKRTACLLAVKGVGSRYVWEILSGYLWGHYTIGGSLCYGDQTISAALLCQTLGSNGGPLGCRLL